MVQIQEILSELDPTNNSSTFYKSNASSIKGIILEVSSYHSLIAYCAELSVIRKKCLKSQSSSEKHFVNFYENN